MASVAEQKTKAYRADLPGKSKALVVHAPGDYRLEDVNTPRAGEGELIVKVEACGVCAGDLKAYHGAPSFWGGEGNPAYIKAPVIPGHEFVGYIVEIGENVDNYAHHGDMDFKVGDRVVSEQIVPQWNDMFSTTGRYWMDEQHDVYGFQNNVNGGFSQYMRFPKEAINFKVPKELPIEKAILTEPYACSKHGVDRAQITNDDVVVISGAGVIGLGMVGFAARRNPKKLIVLDLQEHRLEKAKQFGADEVLNPSKIDVVEHIRKQTGGYGADIYIEVSGHPKSVQQGLEILRKMGRFVEFSVFKDLVEVDWSIISDRKELDVLGGHLSPYCFPATIEGLANGNLPADGVVTHKLPLSEWKNAFELVSSGAQSIKVILFPNEEYMK